MARRRAPQMLDEAVIDDNIERRKDSRKRKSEVTDDLTESFAKTLNILLEEKQIHQKQLAFDTGIGTGTISDYRNGKALPNAENLFKLSSYLDVDCHYLLTGIQAEHFTCSSELGLLEKAISTLEQMVKDKQFAGLKILSDLISDVKFWEAIANINYARYASANAERPMSSTLEYLVFHTKEANKIDRHPGATILEPEQMKDMNLYQASQKFSECASRIAENKKTTPKQGR